MEEVHKDKIAVDDNDNIIGFMPMIEIIEKGYNRRASRVFVFNEVGQLLVQERSENVLEPLLLDQSVGGHVDAGESYEEAAVREMEEELGISGFKLQEIVTSFKTTGFMNAVYKIIIPVDVDIKFDPHELKQVIWYDVEKLDEEMEKLSSKFRPHFIEVWRSLRARLIA